MPAIQQLRCIRHHEREAAAKCILCGNFFCRECVTEHDGRMLCAPCLRLDSGQKRAGQKSRRRLPLQAILALFSIVLLWLIFYGAGRLLLTVPDRFHEGVLPPKEKQTP